MPIPLLSSAAVRRCLVADEGYSFVSADFDQIELRVAAALAGEEILITAAKAGESLHKTAAVKLWGEDYTPDEYRYTKNVNFGWLFGGGANTLSRQAGIPLTTARDIIREYETTFQALTAYKRKQTEKVLKTALSTVEYARLRTLRSEQYRLDPETKQGRIALAALRLQIAALCRRKVGYVYNPFGRRLPVDAHKAYAATNYVVQSSARDIMAYALLRAMEDERLEPGILLIVHDEILAQYRTAHAEKAAKKLAEVMTTEFMGVPITADGKVYGASWGHGYGAEE